MKTGFRVLVTAAAFAQALLATGAGAQDTGTAAQQTPPASQPPTGTIGPAQLKDFNLSGKVTRESTAPVEVKPAPTANAAPASGQTRTLAPAPSPQRVAQPERTASPAAKPARIADTAAIDRSAPVAPSADASPRVKPKRSPPVTSRRVAAAELPTFPHVSVPSDGDSNAATLNAQGSGPSPLLWILAAIVAGGAAAFFFFRQNSRGFAGIPHGFDPGRRAPPAPEPAPKPAPPQARDASPAPPTESPPRPTAPTGLVSTRLRPWIELEIVPTRVTVDEQRAVVEFDLSLFNSGNAPAFDVLAEGAIFNAGVQQDQKIGGFFENPVGQGQRIPVIAPMQRLAVKSAVVLPREQFQPLEVQGRPILVPMVAFNALYRWGSGNGQTSRSYLVGKTTEGEKLAPFRLDLGPRVWRKLGARQHELEVRV
jgi:hypothetical protein